MFAAEDFNRAIEDNWLVNSSCANQPATATGRRIKSPCGI